MDNEIYINSNSFSAYGFQVHDNGTIVIRLSGAQTPFGEKTNGQTVIEIDGAQSALDFLALIKSIIQSVQGIGAL